MYERILFPTDGSEVASSAFEYVLELAAGTGATLRVLNVADTTRDSVTRIGGEVVDLLEREGERIVGEAADRADERGVSVVTDVLQGPPARTIVEYAREFDADLVVVPTHGRRGIRRLLLGSVAERVVRTATVPVLTLRPDGDPAGRYPFGNVLVATDGSDSADAALAEGVGLAAASGATLHLLHVVDTTGLGIDVRSTANVERLEDAAEGILSAAAGTAAEASVESVVRAIEHGPVVETIDSYAADHDVDVVVVGTHGRTGLDRYVLGSVAENLVRTSPVPVLTVREPDPDA